MKKTFNILTILIAAVMLSSCIIVTEDSYVTIENRDSNRSAYISKVEYQEEGTCGWTQCWQYNSYHTDSNINFSMDSGYYKFRITVIYPKYDGYRDYYDEFTNSRYEYISCLSDSTWVFDGEYLSKKY